MEYVIRVCDEGTRLARPVDPADEAYMRAVVLPRMRPLSDDEYMNGPAVIQHTLARFSYILDNADLYWCIEWDPGLAVIRFRPDGQMAWGAFRSPNPEFGGRTASEEEQAAFNELDANPQCNLVFRAWDAQFDDQRRDEWSIVSETTAKRFEAALAHANSLGETLRQRYGASPAYEAWLERCQNSLVWKGETVMD